MTTRAESLAKTIRCINPAGVLSTGRHDAHAGECCIMEALSVHLGLDWTDRPDVVGMPDIRAMNDAPWSSDQLRTEHIVRLAEALEPWSTWSEDQRLAYARRVVLWTVRNLIADLPGLPDAVRKRCQRASTLGEAEAASWAAEAASVAASAAAEAAARASWAAGVADASWAAAASVAWASEAAEAASWAAAAASEAAVAAVAWAAEDPDATLIRAVNGWIACLAEH